MWRSNCIFIFKGVSLCFVSHLHAPHHSCSQSGHGNNYRWVFPFHYHFTNIKTVMLKWYLFVIIWFRMWSQDILFKVLRIQIQLHWELCCMLTIWRLPSFICHRAPTEVELLETTPRQKMFWWPGFLGGKPSTQNMQISSRGKAVSFKL